MDTTTANNTSNTPEPQVKPILLEVVERARVLEQTLADLFDDTQRAAAGTLEVWAPKDHFVHLAVWQGYQAQRLAAIATGNPPEQPADNDEVFQHHRDDTWDDAWAMARRALDEDAAVIAGVSEDDLAHSERFPWMNGRSLVTTTVSNVYLHPSEHLVQAYDERGDLAAAEQAQRETVATMLDLFGKGEGYANAVYNLGCFYAKHGRADDAIAQVREALAINPQLTEWSKEDADLVSLHGLPAYQALYTDM